MRVRRAGAGERTGGFAAVEHLSPITIENNFCLFFDDLSIFTLDDWRFYGSFQGGIRHFGISIPRRGLKTRRFGAFLAVFFLIWSRSLVVWVSTNLRRLGEKITVRSNSARWVDCLFIHSSFVSGLAKFVCSKPAMAHRPFFGIKYQG